MVLILSFGLLAQVEEPLCLQHAFQLPNVPLHLLSPSPSCSLPSPFCDSQEIPISWSGGDCNYTNYHVLRCVKALIHAETQVSPHRLHPSPRSAPLLPLCGATARGCRATSAAIIRELKLLSD